MPAFGATVRGFWTARADGASCLIALLSFAEGVDPAEFTAAYVASREFASDMKGFDLSDIVGAEEQLLEPVEGSPLA